MLNKLNNFNQLLEKKLLEFKEGEFYFLQILQRKKENPNLRGNSKVIKTYYIDNLDYYNDIQEEVMGLCEFFNARAYMGLNRRSYKRVALHTMRELADLIINEQYVAAKKAYNTTCGQYTVGDKLWIVDVDSTDFMNLQATIHAINKCASGFSPVVVTTLCTLNGYHIITRPFNIKQLEPFMATNPLDIHKNNPTLVYYNNTNVK